MGQQQLLLLVLATVIVGLATVAGIQAFNENQQQAKQDALIQRTNALAQDLAAAAEKPSQLGGVSFKSDNATKVAKSIGLSSDTEISAGGAGTSAGCKITTSSSSATVECGSDGADSGTITVDVTVTPANDDPIGDPSISVTS